MADPREALSIERLVALATELLDCFACGCNEEGNPAACDCGGDGTTSDHGCWACQAHTALHGHGTVPLRSVMCCDCVAEYMPGEGQTICPACGSMRWRQRS